MKILLLILVLTSASCGKQGKSKLFRIEETSVTKFVNDKSLPADPNLTLDKTIVNNAYPIEIALYKDHKFYYNLPNLGDGTGTWEYSNGKIELKAKRTLFNMYIEVHGSDEKTQSLSIQFSDRFGPNTLKMTNANI